MCRDKTYTIQSPDCSLTVTIGCGDRIVFHPIGYDRLKPSPLARPVSGECWGRRASRPARYRIDEARRTHLQKAEGGGSQRIVTDFRRIAEFRPDDAVAYRHRASAREVLVAGEEAVPPGSRRIRAYVRATPCRHDGLRSMFMQSFENTTPVRFCEMDSPAWRSCRCSCRRPGV